MAHESKLESSGSSRFIQSDLRHSSKHTALMLRLVIHINRGSVTAVLPTLDLFAQVLPVPVGKSIRGRGAVITGCLILAASVVSGASCLIAMDEVTRAAIVIGVIGAALVLCALGAYIWCPPAAARDFDRD